MSVGAVRKPRGSSPKEVPLLDWVNQNRLTLIGGLIRVLSEAVELIGNAIGDESQRSENQTLVAQIRAELAGQVENLRTLNLGVQWGVFQQAATLIQARDSLRALLGNLQDMENDTRSKLKK